DSAIGEETFVLIKTLGEEGLTNFDARLARDQLPLREKEERLALVTRQFDEFVRKNRLVDIAPMPRSNSAIRSAWAWVAVLVFAESALNGMFFAEGSRAG